MSITSKDIKRIRGVMCLSQEEFAGKVGVSLDYIKGLESGKFAVTVNVCCRLNYLVHTYDFWKCQNDLERIVTELSCYS